MATVWRTSRRWLERALFTACLLYTPIHWGVHRWVISLQAREITGEAPEHWARSHKQYEYDLGFVGESPQIQPTATLYAHPDPRSPAVYRPSDAGLRCEDHPSRWCTGFALVSGGNAQAPFAPRLGFG